MKYFELEFKYKADSIDLDKFREFCKSRTPVNYLHASGFDNFYENTKEADSFCRHRVGPDINQLTFKRKTTDSNSYLRTEHNIGMQVEVTSDQITALCSEFGYKYSYSIFKTCFIYNFEYYTLVYYVCYDKKMKELGRFVEIEMREDYNWDSQQHAWDELVTLERLCKPLGITPQNRTKLNLYEMFK